MDTRINTRRVFVSETGRDIKARKIEAILCDFLETRAIEGMHVLDLGCGIGTIADHFSSKNVVTGADVDDRRAVQKSSLKFVLLDSEVLPFDNGSFDIVISNHVIEHLPYQAVHLREIRRVLRDRGVAYVAIPNRNFPVEPHYGVPLIHYLPFKLFNRTLKILGKYREDLFLLSYSSMKALFLSNGFEVFEYTARILADPAKFHLERTWPSHIPNFALGWAKIFSPTNIFVLRKAT